MPKLQSKMTSIVNICGVNIRPGANDISDADLKKIVAHKDGAFLVENAKFSVPKATASKDKDK